jgi:hypothetical protein
MAQRFSLQHWQNVQSGHGFFFFISGVPMFFNYTPWDSSGKDALSEKLTLMT